MLKHQNCGLGTALFSITELLFVLLPVLPEIYDPCKRKT